MFSTSIHKNKTNAKLRLPSIVQRSPKKSGPKVQIPSSIKNREKGNSLEIEVPLQSTQKSFQVKSLSSNANIDKL